MIKFIRKILWGNPNEYITVRIPDKIDERVYLETGALALDISKIHWILSLDPMVIGVWIHDPGHRAILDKENRYSIYFRESPEPGNHNKKPIILACMELGFLDKIEEKDGTLFLLRLIRSQILPGKRMKGLNLYLTRFKKPDYSFARFKSLASAYSYPRKVNLISFRQEDYFNLFPMDLLGNIEGSNRHLFGLRHSNVALQKIIETRKMVVSGISYEQKDIIYQLGKHHSANPRSLQDLPFKTFETESFGFYLPEWAENYSEINITKTINLGSHMLLWGQAANTVMVKESKGSLFHIHFLLYLHQQKRGSSYPVA
jgi:hypothetical protein